MNIFAKSLQKFLNSYSKLAHLTPTIAISIVYGLNSELVSVTLPAHPSNKNTGREKKQ